MLQEDELRESILLVFANKQDLPNAMNAAEMTDKLGLSGLRHRQWYIQVSFCPKLVIIWSLKTKLVCDAMGLTEISDMVSDVDIIANAPA